jgi:hypothetical protein
MMYPYPKQYPSDAVKLLIDYVSHGDEFLEKKDAIHAGWVISGYALGRIFGGGPEIIGKKFRATKVPVAKVKRKEFLEKLSQSVAYGSVNKFEQTNPSCWLHLNQLAKEMLNVYKESAG